MCKKNRSCVEAQNLINKRVHGVYKIMSYEDSRAGLQPATDSPSLNSALDNEKSLKPAPVLSQSFARISADISELTLNLTPCARRLYEWLLQQKRSGVPQEVWLEEFAETTASRNRGAYCLAHIKRALKELLDSELVQQVFRYSAKIFKLVAHDSRTFSSRSETGMSKSLIKKSKTEPSNPYPAVVLNREDQRKITDQNQQPVQINREAGLVVQKSNELGATNYPALLEEVSETLQQPLSPNLQQQILNLTICRVRDALDSYREAQRQPKPIRKPEAWFAAALQRCYKPNGWVKPRREGSGEVAQAVSQSQGAASPAGFGEWFALAQRAEVAERGGFVDGVFGVYTREGWESWAEVQQTWPLAKLQSVLATRVVTRTVDEPVPVVQEPTAEERLDPARRVDMLARLRGKFALPQLRGEAVRLAELWGFVVSSAGIAEGVGCG